MRTLKQHQAPPTVKKPENVMMICDGCDAPCHLGCLPSKFTQHVPWIRRWYCGKCTQPCYVCHQEDVHDSPVKRLLKCSGCSEFVHMHCLITPLTEEPRGTWTCSQCVFHSQRMRTRFQAQRDFCSFCLGAIEEDGTAAVSCSSCGSYRHKKAPCLQKQQQPEKGEERSWVCPACT